MSGLLFFLATSLLLMTARSERLLSFWKFLYSSRPYHVCCISSLGALCGFVLLIMVSWNLTDFCLVCFGLERSVHLALAIRSLEEDALDWQPIGRVYPFRMDKLVVIHMMSYNLL